MSSDQDVVLEMKLRETGFVNEIPRVTLEL